MTRSTLSARDLADLTELAGFAHFLALHVEHGQHQAELDAAMETLIRMAKQGGIGPSTVVSAVEMIGCEPLRSIGPDRQLRVDRYTRVMAALLRRFLDA